MLKCVEFLVKVEENAADVAALTLNLPVGKCTIQVFNNETNHAVFYTASGRHIRNINTINRTVSQYFNSTDEKQDRISRWKLLQNEMIANNIKVVKIIVCPKY
jgi:hypothetical protein